MKKLTAIILSLIFAFSSLSVFAFAAEDSTDDVPTIFVDGIASTPIVNTETGEGAFPPSTSAIVGGVKDVIFPLLSSISKDDYSALSKPVCDAVLKIFATAACDKDGNPIYPTNSTYTCPAKDNLADAEVSMEALGIAPDDLIYFSYDWRLDMVTLSAQLHDFVEYVMDATGAEKVNLVGFSMGTCVVMSYLHEYDYEYVNAVVLLAGAFNGASTCGEPFSGKLAFDAPMMVKYINTMMGQDFGGYILQAIIDVVYQAGIVDKLFNLAEELTDAVMADVYECAFKETFARMAGFWSLIPYDIYDEAKALLIGDNVSDAFVEKIDYYHYEIQANNKQIIDTALERGINFAIIAKYGSGIPAVVESMNNIGDGVIDTSLEAYGATCAPIGETLGENYTQKIADGHNHVSPDTIIDASTCEYPEYTWFIKNLNHADHNMDEWALIKYLLTSENQPTVNDEGAPAQFLVSVNDELVPLTAENDSSRFGDVPSDKGSFVDRIVHIFKSFIKAIKALFASIFQR